MPWSSDHLCVLGARLLKLPQKRWEGSLGQSFQLLPLAIYMSFCLIAWDLRRSWSTLTMGKPSAMTGRDFQAPNFRVTHFCRQSLIHAPETQWFHRMNFGAISLICHWGLMRNRKTFFFFLNLSPGREFLQVINTSTLILCAVELSNQRQPQETER